MSDTPGGNPHPRDRRRKDRPRNRHRPPPRNPEAPAPQREGRGPRRRRNRDRSRNQDRERNRPSRPKKSAPATPKSPSLSLGRKLLTILTFGLVRPKTPAAVPPSRKEPPLPKQTTPVPPSDPEAITTPRLHVGNLHYDISEDDLLDLFKGIGPVKNVDIVYSGRTHRSRGFGFVEFISLNDARRAVAELHGQLYMRRPLLLGPARSRGEDEREADALE
jgi:hypothetical protein